MPFPNQMHMFARLKFSSNAFRVPTNWQNPSGDPDSDHYGKAFQPPEKATLPDMVVQPALFSPASANKYHTQTQKELTFAFDGYIHDICKSIADAFSQWQSLATMAGIMITGPVASVGMLVGPPLMPLIMLTAPKNTPQLLKFSNVIATVISNAWQQFTLTVKIPGLPFYPAFAMVPMPVAPPMPNVPVPFATLTQVPVSIGAMIMKQQMVAQLADPMAPFAPALFECICDAFEKCYNLWKVTCMVTNVLGTGPVPTFAPPYVPGGPVVGGIGTMAPGGLAGPPLDIPPLPPCPNYPSQRNA